MKTIQASVLSILVSLSIVATAAARDSPSEPFLAGPELCQEVATELAQSVAIGLLKPAEANRIVERCHHTYGVPS